MQPWVWLAAYVLGFGLLQVVLYRRFSRRTPSPETTEGRAARTDGGHAVAPATADTVVCQHCGESNDAHRMVRYCGSCTESLR